MAAAFAFEESLCSILPPCLFRTVFGVSCPGCGSARALLALVRGDLASALVFNAPL
ncbi:MAG: DUF2752 domain-containing protein, partial [Thermoanaerobaculia bacterium]